VLRNWILEEVIERVEKKGERDILQRVLAMALEPFREEWGGVREEEERFCGVVPKYKSGLQCSCSS
jgi:serine/tyrosine/threonine adenylyltransferase